MRVYMSVSIHGSEGGGGIDVEYMLVYKSVSIHGSEGGEGGGGGEKAPVASQGSSGGRELALLQL